MRTTIRNVLAGAVLAIASTQSYAQESVTNLVQELKIKLTAYYQMDPTTNGNTLYRNAGKASVSNKDIIALLGLQLSVAFSSDAKLLLMSHMGVDANPQVVVRDTVAGETVDTDVTQYFYATRVSSVENTKGQLDPFKVKGKSYDVIQFNMVLAPATFQVQGYSEATVQTVEYQGEPIGVSHNGSFKVSGSGTYAAAPSNEVVDVTLTGSIEIKSKDVQVVTP